MSFLRNKPRLSSDRRFYSQTDTYDVPGRLRVIRSKHCYGFPRSVSFFQEDKSDVREKFLRLIDEDEAFSKHMSTFWGSCALFGLRSLTFLREVLFRQVPQPARVSNMNSSSDDVELGRFSSNETLLARAAEAISHTTLNLLENRDEEKLVITNSNSDGNLCDGVFRKFKMNVGSEESVHCVEVSLMYEKSFFDNLLAEKNDLKSIVLSEKCACVVWIWSEQTRIVVITESSNPNSWSLQQWYKKVLADMTLMDSRLIGHPYYWHPMVRRRLGRVVKRFKKLYRRIEELEAIKKGLPISTVTLFENSLRKGSRRRESQSFIEELDEDSQCNDEFLVRDFIPGMDRTQTDRYSTENKSDSGVTPIGDCYNKESEYHMNILDSDSDGSCSGFSGGEDSGMDCDYEDSRKSKIHRKYRPKDKYYCESDINPSEPTSKKVLQHSDCNFNQDNLIYNRNVVTENFETHEEENSVSKHKIKRRTRRQQKGGNQIMAFGGRETMNFDDSKAYRTASRATSEDEVPGAAALSLSRDSLNGDIARDIDEYFGLVKGPGSGESGTVSNSSSAADIPGERLSGEIDDEDDPSILKLGLSRSRSTLPRSNLGQSDSEDRLAGPPLINFNEPLLFMDNADGGDFPFGGPGGVAGDSFMDNPPVVGARAAISVRALNSEDDLVSQLGLETPSLRNGSNNGTICCRHLSNHNISIASLDLEANNFNGHCHNFGQCCAHGYRHKLGGGKTLRQRHFSCVPLPVAPATL